MKLLQYIIVLLALALQGLSAGLAQTDGDSLQELLTNAATEKERVETLNNLAWHYLESDLKRAKKVANEALAICQKNKWPKLESGALNGLANYHFLIGNYDSAGLYHEASFQLRNELKDTSLIANAAYSCGIAFSRAGVHFKAIQYFKISSEYYKVLGDQKRLFRTLIQQANAQIDIHQLVGSDSTLEQAASIMASNAINDSKLKADYNLAKAGLLMTKKDYETSHSVIRRALTFYASYQNTEEQARVYNTYGNALFYLDILDSSIHYYKKACTLVKGSKNNLLKLKCFSNLAQAQGKFGNAPSAKTSFHKAFATGKQLRDSTNLATLFKLYGDHLTLDQQHDSAVVYYRFALRNSPTASLLIRSELFYNIHNTFSYLHESEKARKALWKHLSLNDSINAGLLKLNVYERQLEQQAHVLKLYQLETDKKVAQGKLKTQNLIYIVIVTGILIVLLLAVIAYQREKASRKLAEKDKELSEKNKTLLEEKIDGLLKKQELKSIVNVLEIQEKERRRIAQDLHDRLGGMIATMKLLFYDVQEHLNEVQSQFTDTYDKALGILDEAGDEVRRVSYDLVSGALKNFGLEVALKELADTIQQSESVSFEFICHGLSNRLSVDHEAHIYRIVQEMVSNTLKHAQAGKITLQLLRDNGRLNIIYEDNGIGFNNTKRHEGLGLTGISSRVDKLDGEFHIDSGKGAGTTYNITIPIKKEEL